MSFYEELQELVRRTRNNPELFHRLVYEPETVLGEIGFLSEEAKRQILGLSPAELTAKLLGCEHGTGAEANACTIHTCAVTCGVSGGCGACTDGTVCNKCATACVQASMGCSDCTVSQCVGACTDRTCVGCSDDTCGGGVSACGGGGTCVDNTAGGTGEYVEMTESASSANFREFRL
jgi:hypothetical protein